MVEAGAVELRQVQVVFLMAEVLFLGLVAVVEAPMILISREQAEDAGL